MRYAHFAPAHALCSVIEAESQEKAEIEAQRQKAELAADSEAAGNK
jgi:hypothetical protein